MPSAGTRATSQPQGRRRSRPAVVDGPEKMTPFVASTRGSGGGSNVRHRSPTLLPGRERRGATASAAGVAAASHDTAVPVTPSSRTHNQAIRLPFRPACSARPTSRGDRAAAAPARRHLRRGVPHHPVQPAATVGSAVLVTAVAMLIPVAGDGGPDLVGRPHPRPGSDGLTDARSPGWSGRSARWASASCSSRSGLSWSPA